MKVVQVHNRYRFYGGEDQMFESTLSLLKERGDDVLSFDRKSDNFISLYAKIRALREGIYSSSTKHSFSSILKSWHPDVVHVHNVYPLISPSVMVASREYGVPVVMRCPNYRLICPTGFFLRNGAICELCARGREYWCFLRNCRGNIFESFGYAVRSTSARVLGLFRDNVTCYIAPTEFVKDRLVMAGFSKEQIFVVPNMVAIPTSATNAASEEHGAYVGRISREKGIEILLAAARQTGFPIHVAGDYSGMPEIVEAAPSNVKFMGQLKRGQLDAFYQSAKFLVVPSICFETFGLVAAEAMGHGIPVIASRIGGLQEVVEDGVTGFLFKPGDTEGLANKMSFLWGNPELCSQMGQAGRKKAVQEYCKDTYYNRLVHVYHKAIEMNTGGS